MKILLAIDDSKFSAAASQVIAERVRPEHTEVFVLHVVEPLSMIPYQYLTEVRSLEAAQQRHLAEGKELVERTRQLLSKAGFTVQAAVEEGDPRATIVDRAVQWSPDLIAVGSRGRRGLDRLLIGSVAEFIVRHAHCTVMIVRVPLDR